MSKKTDLLVSAAQTFAGADNEPASNDAVYNVADSLNKGFAWDEKAKKLSRQSTQQLSYVLQREHFEMTKNDDKPAAWSILAAKEERLSRTTFCNKVMDRAYGPMPAQPVRGETDMKIAQAQQNRRNRMAVLERATQSAAEFYLNGIDWLDYSEKAAAYRVSVSALLAPGQVPMPGSALARHDAAKEQVLLNDGGFLACLATDETKLVKITASLQRVKEVIALRKTAALVEAAKIDARNKGQNPDALKFDSKGKMIPVAPSTATAPVVPTSPGVIQPVIAQTSAALVASPRDTQLPVGRGDFDSLVLELSALITGWENDTTTPAMAMEDHPIEVQNALNNICTYVLDARRLSAIKVTAGMNGADFAPDGTRDEPVMSQAAA